MQTQEEEAEADSLAAVLPAPLRERLRVACQVISPPGAAVGSEADHGMTDRGQTDPEATGPEQVGVPLGLDVHLREHTRAAQASGGPPDDAASGRPADPPEQVMIEGVQAMLFTERWSQAQSVALARKLSVRAGTVLLARREVDDPQQLTPSARRRWRAQTKSVVANELSAATGLGIQECHDRVGIALAPPAVVGPALAALEEARTDFRQVRHFWQKCRNLRPASALAVCQAVFSPEQTERLEEGEAAESDTGPYPPEGHWRPRSWEEFRHDLDRELTRAEGGEAQRTRRRRAMRLELRDATAFLEDAGIGSLTVEGRATSVAAATARLDKAARRVRQLGDPRPLHQLRSDLAFALLVHGTLPGMPGARTGTAAEHGENSAFHRPALDPDGDTLVELDHRAWQVLHGLPAAQLQVIVPLDCLVNPASTAVAAIPGLGHLPPEQARELALTPGTTIHRLVTDPLDGRLVERTTRSYRPDAAMTAQVIAADGHCRGPGCTRPPSVCERDHELPFAADGVTSETNLSLKHGRHHWLKTMGYWHSSMDADRTVRWTTFFGRRYLTRAHDYRQYLEPPRPCPWADPHDPASVPTTYDPALAEQDPTSRELPADLAPETQDALVYAALAHRDTGETLMAVDDYEGADLVVDTFGADLVGDAPVLQLRHLTPGGATRRGAPEDQPTPVEVVASARAGSDGPEPGQ